MELSIKERAAIAEQLIRSLDGPADDDVEIAWQKEIQKRIEEIDNGEVELIPWEEIREKAWKKFGV